MSPCYNTHMTKSMKKVMIAVLCAAGAIIVLVGAFFVTAIVGFGGRYTDADGRWRRATWKSSVSWTMEHPAFDGYGKYLLPWREGSASSAVPWMSYFWMCATTGWNTDDVVDGVNFMMAREEEDGVRFIAFYDDGEISDSPDKADTGLIYIPGDGSKPFAFVVPGGGFTSEAVTAEGFTAARELHERGYPVFILIYRVSIENAWSEQEALANADFGAAMRYIFGNASDLGVRTDGYSVWGYSAGGRLSWLWGLDNEFGYEEHGVTAPTAVILSYSGWHEERFADDYGGVPPTFFGYCENDKVIGEEKSKGIERYIEELRLLGTYVEAHVYDAPHGYGTGAGTEAYGWMESAYAFWEKHM